MDKPTSEKDVIKSLDEKGRKIKMDFTVLADDIKNLQTIRQKLANAQSEIKELKEEVARLIAIIKMFEGKTDPEDGNV